MRNKIFLRVLITVMLVPLLDSSKANSAEREEAEAALRRAVDFFRTRVAVQGTYLWNYSADLRQREGENQASSTQGWVQPPGTPAVGLAYLAAWKATGMAECLDAARETARGLKRGQLRSGGWTYSIDFSPEGRRRTAYRDDGGAKGRNVSTLDDDTTQCALRFLMQLDQALQFSDGEVRECVDYALTSLLEAQYPNGAWPQGFDVPPEPERHPVHPASPASEWSRVWPGGKDYWRLYTLNDDALVTTVETLLEAGDIYGASAARAGLNRMAQRCRAAARKGGEFLLLARMPEPQPAWAQQYDFDMHPAWARKFEPPAISGRESQEVLRLLLRLYRETGDGKFLDPIPGTLEYLRRSRLPDGRLARFYELGSNKPLYFTRDYTLTYDDRSVPTHYAFKVKDETDFLAREYEEVRNSVVRRPKAKSNGSRPDPGGEREDGRIDQVREILAAQDDEGRWIEAGQLRTAKPASSGGRVIRSATFIRHVGVLSRYLEATRSTGGK